MDEVEGALLVPLAEATAEDCGGKAGALGALLRAGLPVPDGFVVPSAVHRGGVREPTLVAALERVLGELGDAAVAVRSSAADEDLRGASAAGQYESTLAVRGAADVAAAVRACWASLYSRRAATYRAHVGAGEAEDLAMAVIVQRHVDAAVSGVMFTRAGRGEPTVIEASWGLGPSVVAGAVTPDVYRVDPDGRVTCEVADKRTRLDRQGAGLLTRAVPVGDRRRPSVDDATAAALHDLGREAARTLGAPQDIEWAVADGRIWLLQARPITAPPPASRPAGTSPGPRVLTGTPGSLGTATGTARTVRGPRDFSRVRPGDVLVCPFTDPAWTPLLRIVAGVVTETGGALSHAAIVAREQGIPAVLGVLDAVAVIADGTEVTIDGANGTVIATPGGPISS